MPLDERDTREREVRRAILQETFKRLQVDANASWSDHSVDLTGADIDDLTITDPIRVRRLILQDVVINSFTLLDDVLLDDGHLDLSGATVRADLRVLGTLEGHSTIWLTGVKVELGASLHVGVWQSVDA